MTRSKGIHILVLCILMLGIFAMLQPMIPMIKSPPSKSMAARIKSPNSTVQIGRETLSHQAFENATSKTFPSTLHYISKIVISSRTKGQTIPSTQYTTVPTTFLPFTTSHPDDADICRVFDMDPFDPSIARYFKHEPDPTPCPPRRDFVQTQNNSIWLLAQYRNEVVSHGRKCFYTVFEGQKRGEEEEEKPKAPIEFDPKQELVVNASFILIDCRMKNETKDKSNTFGVHLPFRPPEMAARKAAKWEETLESLREHSSSSPSYSSSSSPLAPRFNIHMIGFDSVSQKNAVRQLNATRSFLLNELNATEFLLYNKVGKNTLPNWAALHTGWSLEYEEKTKIQKPRIWSEFSKKGFWTIYAEDWELTGLAIKASGFPFDYRYRVPAKAIASINKEASKVFNMYSWKCFNGRRNGDIKLDWFSNFLDTHRDYSHEDALFSFIWETHMTHDHLNYVRFCDKPYSKLMKQMKAKGDLENSVLVFFSDHGLRFGSFATTEVGDKENNLPFLYIAFPQWFHHQFPELVANVRKNVRKLTTHFDLHKTLLHLLHLQTNTTAWKNDFSNGSQTAYSLMTDKIPRRRTCEDAGIPEAFCSCYKLRDVEPESEVALHAGSAFVEQLNTALENVSDICVRLKMEKVVKCKKIEGRDKYKIHVKTLPLGLFEGWVEFKHGLTSMVGGVAGMKESGNGKRNGSKGDHDHDTIVNIKIGEVARLDSNKDTSYCVWKRNVTLKELCYCKVQKGKKPK